MYYTIEGKRVLGILYIAGLITGTLFFNITIKMQVFKVSDFLDFTAINEQILKNIQLNPLYVDSKCVKQVKCLYSTHNQL